MAKEIVGSDHEDLKQDVYSLGVTLYDMLLADTNKTLVNVSNGSDLFKGATDMAAGMQRLLAFLQPHITADLDLRWKEHDLFRPSLYDDIKDAEELQQLIQSMVRCNKGMRIDMNEVVAKLTNVLERLGGDIVVKKTE
jgi:hypothetical protein